jgi:hypothetical protein
VRRALGGDARDGRQQEDAVVHGQREQLREEEDGRPGVDEGVWLEAERSGQRAVQKHEPGDAAGRRRCEQVQRDRRGRGGRRTEDRSEHRETDRVDETNDERRAGEQGALEVAVLRRRIADQRMRRQRAPQPVERRTELRAAGRASRAWRDERPLARLRRCHGGHREVLGSWLRAQG